MFQYPSDQYHSSTPSNPTHAALNIQLSFHCDTVSTTVLNALNSPDFAKLVQTACGSVLNQPTGTSASGQSATAASWGGGSQP